MQKAAGVMCPGAHLPGGRVKQGKSHRGSPWTPKGPLHAKAEVVLDVEREEYQDFDDDDDNIANGYVDFAPPY